MSRLDEIKDQLKATLTRLGSSIQETEAYNQLQDRYQSLNPSSQKLVWVAGGFLVAGLLLYYPLSQISTSQEMITTFEDKRALIRDLFKTHRESTGQSNIPVPPPAMSLRSSIEQILEQASLIPEQRVGTTEASADGKLIPQSLVNTVFEVKLAKLNLKQIVDIGANLTGISESVKMKDMTISAHPRDTRYFDVTYKLYSLKVPEMAPLPPIEVETKPKRGRSTENSDNEGSGADE